MTQVIITALVVIIRIVINTSYIGTFLSTFTLIFFSSVRYTQHD